MSVAPSKNARSFILLALGLLFLFAWCLGYRGLNDPDEGRYSNIALNFLKPGADLWEPRMSGFAHYDKPPLIYWTTALSFKVFGQNETAARLPAVLGAVLALVGLGWTAARLYGKEVAWWAILICGTLGQFWLLARILTPDMLLTGWCTLAIAAWAECRHRKGDWRFWGLSLLFWTLAWWTKATPALIPLLGLALAVLFTKDEAGKKSLRPLFLLLGILVLGSIWYVRMIEQHGELVDFFFIREMKGRITGHIEGRKGPFYYYAALCLVAWLPWWPMVVRAMIVKWKAARPTRTDLIAMLGVEGWIVIMGTLIFSCVSSKLPSYTLPLAPWAALFFARWILTLKESLPPKNFNRWIIVSVSAIVVLFMSAAVVLPRFESRLRFNSSLRETAAAVKEHGGDVVYLDRYWPGMEFYFGPNTFYVLPDDYLYKAKHHQRSDDPGIDPTIGERHIYLPQTWNESLAKHSGQNIWVVHSAKQSPSPFDQFLSPTNGLQAITVGDFLLVHLSGEALASVRPPQKF